jgi:hypothetical protein
MSELKYEFLKLSTEDLQFTLWLYNKHPKSLYPKLKLLKKIYQKEGVHLNVDKLYNEFTTMDT